MLTAKTMKRLQITQAQLQVSSYAPKHNQETSMLKHNCKRLLINDVHNTNQIQTLKTLGFIRYEL